MLKSISVVLPNYNGQHLLEENIPLLCKALLGIEDTEIIIADDASTDDSIKFIKKKYPDIILVTHKRNQGFSKNINSAIKKASKELVLLLNTDVLLTENYFEHLLPYFEDGDTFGVMGMVKGIDEGEIQDAAKYPTIGMTSIRANINYLPSEEFNNKIPTLFLSGGWSLVDRLKLEELGGFDEIYSPFYGEDVDLSLRAWRLGYQSYFEPKAICQHPSSTTIKKIKKSKVKVIAKRNKMLLHFIHLSNIHMFLYLLVLTIKIPFRLVVLDTNYVKAFIRFLTLLPRAKASKRWLSRLQKSRNSRLSLNDIKLKILGDIGNVEIKKF